MAIGVLAGVLTAGAARVEVFPQSFEAGGWGLDAGLMDVIGSPHLIAHGMGRPVPDATARVVFPEAGVWRVFVRAKNWTEGAPGKFSLLVNGTALKHVFGAGERAWAWEDGGTAEGLICRVDHEPSALNGVRVCHVSGHDISSD